MMNDAGRRGYEGVVDAASVFFIILAIILILG